MTKIRAVDLNFRMHQPLAVLGRHPDGFGGAERLLVEFEGCVGVADDEMGGDDLDGVGHGALLSWTRHEDERAS